MLCMAPACLGAPASIVAGNRIPCVVTRVVDGDTIRCRIRGAEERVRLTGIDAPELAQEPHGPMSSAALGRMASVGDTVVLEVDVQDRDRHGRRLAYVWRDSVMLNLEMVRQGWALPYTVPPNVRYEDRFRSAQRQAREGEMGLWGVNGFACQPAQYRRGACGQ